MKKPINTRNNNTQTNDNDTTTDLVIAKLDELISDASQSLQVYDNEFVVAMLSELKEMLEGQHVRN